ncbi:MAG: DUF4982 domain-containing protein [Prolixibacteraceae bacterium]|nr:DUF4982 domain-containing protein [Prolixibacteraceae bacterium]
MKHINIIIVFFFCTIFFYACSNSSTIRIKAGFNENWKFIKGDLDNANIFTDNTLDWRSVKIPHDWSIEGSIEKENPSGHFGGFYPGGVGFYQKTFQYKSNWKNKLVEITFDGIYMNSEVWINDHYLGKRPNGYVGFSYDLTPFLKKGQNTLLVKADNSAQPNSRWYTGSGIYRNVWLQVKNPVSVIKHGTYIVAENISSKSADIKIKTSIGNKLESGKVLELVSEVYSPTGSKVSEVSSKLKINTADTAIIDHALKVDNPALWSPDSPVQYKLISKIKNGKKIIDEYVSHFGIRSIRFDSETGFWMNNKNIKIKGVNNHHDAGPVGAAVPDDVLHRRLQILKKMGCNAIRTAHNPFSPEFYNMCDSMGFLVMDEVFDEWIASWPWVDYKNRGKVKYGYHLYFNEWAMKDLQDVILRDRNHPSVIMWSIGNEIPDQCYPEGPERLKPLIKKVHELDPTRPVTAGCCFMHLANETGFSSMLDVAGYNGGGGSVFYEKDKAVYPDRKFIATEIPHSFQTRGVYKTHTEMRSPHQGIPVTNLTEKEVFPEFSEFYSSSYDNSSVRISARDSWHRTDSLDYVAGEFRWTGFDYLGEAIKGWPARSWNFGIIDLCGFPKDTYYFYQSQWTNEPMVHILPHWTWPGKEGMTIPVWTYSNCDEVELFLNGKSLGKKKNKGEMNLSWDVQYSPGTIKAIGTNNGDTAAEKSIETALEPESIQIIADKKVMIANGESCIHLEINVVDKNKKFVPTANNLIHFNIQGPAKIIGVDNGDPLDLSSTKENKRHAFNGKCIVIIQSSEETGEVNIEAFSEELMSSDVKLNSIMKH